MGAIFAGATEAQYEALSCYGEHIGLAFQIVDDILDVEESSEALGKTAGKDAAQHKITFPAVYGLPASRAMAEQECARAHQVLEPFGPRAAGLRELADLIVHRKT
jgi:geranylgeranyl pyrophosphate synthase